MSKIRFTVKKMETFAKRMSIHLELINITKKLKIKKNKVMRYHFDNGCKKQGIKLLKDYKKFVIIDEGKHWVDVIHINIFKDIQNV
jgi:hypothetical protein